MGKILYWNGAEIQQRIHKNAEAAAQDIALRMMTSARERAPIRRDEEKVGYRAKTRTFSSSDLARLQAVARNINHRLPENPRWMKQIRGRQFPDLTMGGLSQREIARATRGGRRELPGTLKRSISLFRFEGIGVTYRIAATAPYAKFVEFPTRRTRAQPFMLPALKGIGSKALDIAHEKIGGRKIG